MKAPTRADDGDTPIAHPDDTRAAAVREVVFAPIRGEGLVQQTVRRLADAIRLGLLGEGERLPRESELAERLGISAMTLREAFAVLREAGWIATTRGKGGGTVVIQRAAEESSSREALDELTPEYLYDLTAMRRAVTGEASALAAARATTAEADRIAALAREMKRAMPVWQYRQADAAFHIAIAVAARCQRLSAAEAELQVEFNDVISAGLQFFPSESAENILRASTREHQQLARAIRAHDDRRARSIALTHVTGSRDLLLAIPPATDEPQRRQPAGAS